MRLSQRIDRLPAYIFLETGRKIAEKKARGEEVVNFAVGDPDLPTPENIIEKMCRTARDPANHRYPESDGMPELRRAIAGWYRNRFGVDLDADKEVMPLIGSKEGIGHIAFCLIDQGDNALIPEPGYPVYAASTTLAGGNAYFLPLTGKDRFLPNLSSVPRHILDKSKMLWLNYPNNPTGAVADIGFFDHAVGFARENELAVCHDMAYSEVSYDGYRPVSFLQAEGAREVGIEFHSLSKSYNMTGWRVGMAVGNAEMIDALKRLKSNLDSGIPRAIQYAAIEALNGDQAYIEERNRVYQRRRDLILDVLQSIGMEARPPRAGLYIWARIPEGYKSAELADELLETVGVAVTPGDGYGKSGEGYIRLSLTIPDASLVKGLSRLAQWRNSKRGQVKRPA